MITIEFKSYKGGDGKSTAAFAFWQVLENSDLVDLDLQKTLTRACELTGKKRPINPEEARGDYLIFDTPPYRQAHGLDVSRKVDFIIVPAKSTYNSLLSFESLYGDLKKNYLLKKTWLFFNEVRKPIDKTHQEVADLFAKNFKGLQIAKTVWSNLKGFKEILLKGVEGKAKNQVKDLISELKIK